MLHAKYQPYRPGGSGKEAVRMVFIIYQTGNTPEGDVSDVIALDQLMSPFPPRKATRMSP